MRLYQWNASNVYDGVFFDIEDLAAALPARTTPNEPHVTSEGQESHWSGDEWQLREIQPLPQLDVDWPALIASRRWDSEVSGIDVNGIHVETDDRSKLLINGAALEAVIDPEYSMQWKTPGGFVDLSASQVIAVARAVRAHVQACFDREAVLLDAVANGTITAEMIEEGWPNEPLPESAPS